MNDNTAKDANPTGVNLPPPEFTIQRIYIKDLSFESPQAPKVFQENLQPAINLNIHTASSILDQDTHEVVLTTTITAAVDTRTIFLIEVKQAGIFTIKNIPEENMGVVLGVTCPTILFPYVREVVSEMAAKGSFQHFYLAPINFEALYMNSLKQKESETTH
jgi:preprotein translocase subunit SecB